MQPEAKPSRPGRIEVGLPSRYYVDPDHYERELEAIWYRHWLPVCRADELSRPRDYRVVAVGDQSLLLVRNPAGKIRAFHNTCRHRGSVLCTGESGRLRAAAITCPYHAWTYSLDGELLGTPHQLAAENFRREDFPLYPVALGEWGGYVFTNLLGGSAPPLSEAIDEAAAALRSWRLSELAVGRRSSFDVGCNWKVFWENFLECFHCPGVHPELCRIVPTYGKGLTSERELPDARPDAPVAPLAPGAVTWTLDGRSELPRLAGLAPEEVAAGQTFGTHVPSFFAVGHVDYARVVRIRPLGPEQTRLDVDWLFPPEVLERGGFDLEHATALGQRVVEQDSRACELNQRGLHSRAHVRGVLVPQEHAVRDFQQWVLAQLGEGSGAAPERDDARR